MTILDTIERIKLAIFNWAGTYSQAYYILSGCVNNQSTQHIFTVYQKLDCSYQLNIIHF